ncbi:MAG: carboxylating nicotinate-nucleotide diphosphorylase [Chloroflexota bacterium]|nr:carboxylating nicotinate-nucleotide diphosphorylase [Chloroflexota bacterium]
MAHSPFRSTTQRLKDMSELPRETIEEVVRRALAEDVGAGDVTTAAVVDSPGRTEARVVYREPGVVAGIDVVREVFGQLDAAAEVDATASDGTQVAAGDVAAVVRAHTGAMLTGERVALNFLQRLSGVATLTRAFVDAIDGTGVRILDTRKTTPMLRALEKYAVRMGGGANHRQGLYDAVLIKDNHIAAAGGVAEAIAGVRRAAPAGMAIQVEVETAAEAAAAVTAGAQALLFDNMSVSEVERSVAVVTADVRLEVTGGVTLANVREYAATGVHDISVGALTHSARAIDIGLDF